MTKSLIEIQEIVKLWVKDSNHFVGLNLDSPNLDYQADCYEIWFSGWILGKKSSALSIEFVAEGQVIHTEPINQPRPDILETYPNIPKASNCGFITKVEVGQLPEQAELSLQVVFSEPDSVPICLIKFIKKLPFLQQVEKDLERSRQKLQQIESKLKGASNLSVSNEPASLNS